MEQVTLKAVEKVKHGSGASKKLRDTGWLPCVVHGHKDGIKHIAVEKKAFSDVVNKDGELIRFNITLDGKENSMSVLISEVQRNRVKAEAIHCDLQVVESGRPVTVMIPLVLTGTPIGARQGGVLQVPLRKIRVSCLPEDVPQSFDMDVSPLDIGDGVFIRDFAEKYPKLTFLGTPDANIVTLAARSAAAIKAEEKELADAAAAAAGEIVEGAAEDTATEE